MKTAPRYIAVLPEIFPIAQFASSCRIIVDKLSNNPDFDNPQPPLSQVKDHLDLLEKDEKAAQQGGKGAASQRDDSLGLVCRDMRYLKAFVQNKADAHHQSKAVAIIDSAGLRVGKKGDRTRPPVDVRHGKVTGEVLLQAKSTRRPTVYHWQMSTDQETWTELPECLTSRTSVDGLTSAKVYYFRLRTMTTKQGMSKWSDVVSIIVH